MEDGRPETDGRGDRAGPEGDRRRTRAEARAQADGAAEEPGRRPSAGPAFTRRQFAAGAGAALLLPVAARLSPWRVGGTDGSGGARAPDGAASGPGRAQEGEEPPPGTEALTDYVEARWGDRLSGDDREQIRSAVAGNLRAASAIDEVALENSDEPGFVFRPYRGEGP